MGQKQLFYLEIPGRLVSDRSGPKENPAQGGAPVSSRDWASVTVIITMQARAYDLTVHFAVENGAQYETVRIDDVLASPSES